MNEFRSMNEGDSEKSIGLLFMRTYNKWHSEIKTSLKKFGITHPQFVVLATLGYALQNTSEVTQTMISKLSGIDVMTISQILTLLEKKELVSREEHSKDTRAKAAFITPKGQDILNKTLPIVENVDLIFFGKLENNEKTFIEFLHLLTSS